MHCLLSMIIFSGLLVAVDRFLFFLLETCTTKKTDGVASWIICYHRLESMIL